MRYPCIVFLNRLDVFHKSPDSGAGQIKDLTKSELGLLGGHAPLHHGVTSGGGAGDLRYMLVDIGAKERPGTPNVSLK